MEFLKVKIKVQEYADYARLERDILNRCEPITLQEDSENNTIIMQTRESNYYNNINILLNKTGVDSATTISIEDIEPVPASENIVAICWECNSPIYENMETIETADGDTICNDCYQEYYSTCNDCGEIIHNDYSVVTYDGYTICNDCYNHHYFTCEDCGEIYHENDRNVGNNGGWYCNDCICDHEDYEDEEDELLQGYHDHSRTYSHILKTSDSDNTLETGGIELETERGESNINQHTFCERLDTELNSNEKIVHFETDGSLDCGVEIISEPFTMEYWEREKTGIFKKLIDKCNEMHYRSHNGGHCGLHLHFSKTFFGTTEEEQQEKIETMLLFFENYQNELIQLSRRENFYYCQFLSKKNSSITAISDASLKNKLAINSKFIKKCKYETGHGDAINVNASTGKTFEIRIMRGTLKYETFVASLEFCFNLIRCIQKEKAGNISFSKVVNYQPTLYLKDYIKERGIKPNYKKMKDYATAQTATAESISSKLERETARTLKKLENEINQRTNKLRTLKASNINKADSNGIKNVEYFKISAENIQHLAHAMEDITAGHYRDARYYINELNVRGDYAARRAQLYDSITNLANLKEALDIIS